MKGNKMKKILILLGIVAVCGFGIYKYENSDTALERDVESFCKTVRHYDGCVCTAKKVREVFGKEKYKEFVSLMNKGNKEDVKHFIIQFAYNSNEKELFVFDSAIQECKAMMKD